MRENAYAIGSRIGGFGSRHLAFEAVSTPGMNPSYCFWSVCTGVYAGMMERCVQTARQVGVFKQFHILTDQPVEGCECYDAFECDKKDGMFKLHYLKVGMSRLNFDYFV